MHVNMSWFRSAAERVWTDVPRLAVNTSGGINSRILTYLLYVIFFKSLLYHLHIIKCCDLSCTVLSWIAHFYKVHKNIVIVWYTFNFKIISAPLSTLWQRVCSALCGSNQKCLMRTKEAVLPKEQLMQKNFSITVFKADLLCFCSSWRLRQERCY